MKAKNVQLYLDQIIDAIEKNHTSTVGLDKETFEDYEIRWLVERGLLIIGEALSRIRNADPDMKISNSNKIISTRNKLAHEYDVVDYELLYSIVHQHLPELKLEIESLKNKEDI